MQALTPPRILLLLLLVLVPTQVSSICTPGFGTIQDVTTDPCVCFASGELPSGESTNRPTCDAHSGGNPFCHTTLQCESANPAPAFPSTKWRECDPAIDNNPTYICAACVGGFSNSETGCTPCPVNTYSPNGGASEADCVACPADRPAASEGSDREEDCGVASVETCFLAKLIDTWGDGWQGNKLSISNDNGEVLFGNIGGLFLNGGTTTEGPFCFTGCRCWTAISGGGVNAYETRWELDIGGHVVAEAEGDEEVRFCAGVCSTNCEAGEQPNAFDDGCEPCKSGWFSDTRGGESCEACR